MQITTHSVGRKARSRGPRIHPMILTVAIAIVVAGCSAQDWRRFFYDVGDQYACQRGNEGRHDESNRDATCTDPARPGRTGFDAYETARKDEGN
jgi:hypothetical protein